MTRNRSRTSGVTLIEMLLALAVASMIGVAGFVLLEGVTRTERGVSDVLARLARQDRAFRLLTLDTSAAISASWRDDSTLELKQFEHLVLWGVSNQAVKRTLLVEGQEPIEQVLLQQSAAFKKDARSTLALHLIQDDVWRLMRLPAGAQ